MPETLVGDVRCPYLRQYFRVNGPIKDDRGDCLYQKGYEAGDEMDTSG
jgi:hypothetical protein